MRNKAGWSGGRERSQAGRVVLRLAVILCFVLGGPPPSAQDVKILSKGSAPVLQIYDPVKDETIITAPMSLEKSLVRLGRLAIGDTGPVRIGLILDNIQYAYPGKVPTRPQNVSFFFSSDEGKDKYKNNRAFSVSADGAVVHQGEAELGRRTIEGDKRSMTEDVLMVTVPTDIFFLVAPAKKVQFKLGPKDYKLSGDQRKQLRIMADMLEPRSERK